MAASLQSTSRSAQPHACEFYQQLKASHGKRRAFREESLGIRFGLKQWTGFLQRKIVTPVILGARYHTDEQLATLALEIRKLENDEYNELCQVVQQKLIAHHSNNFHSPPPVQLSPRRIPFPHPFPIFQGIYGSYSAPCVNSMHLIPLASLIQLAAMMNNTLEETTSQKTTTNQNL